jgi:PAS domain S-box-containing protein
MPPGPSKSGLPLDRTKDASEPTETAWPIFSASLEGRITGCSSALLRLVGYSANELIERSFSSILDAGTESPQQSSLAIANILETISRRGGYEANLILRLKAGGALPVRASATLLCGTGGKPVAICMVAIPAAVNAAHPAHPIENREGSPEPAVVSRTIEGIRFILASPVMHKFMGLVDRVAGHTETVLITGETGTGKEFIARTVHESSNRRGRPWVDINCAALPENLVESELFGYEKGAFSGADSSKPGLFEMADKGTLFLDEIGELQLQMQVKLLRVLDGQPFFRLGGHRKIKVDVRIVAATNQDLEAAVREGRFRKDLFHRLSQFQLRVPPLRERPEDIVALAEHFLKLKAPNAHFSTRAVSVLLSHAWPGNIRELRNLVAKLAMDSAEGEIDFDGIDAAFSGEPSTMRQTASLPVGNLESMEEQMIIRALESTGGRRALAAEQLGISRRTLSRKLKEYNINAAIGEGRSPLGLISNEQQKFFRARVEMPASVRNAQGEEFAVDGVNLSTGGMGLAGVKEPLRLAGLLDVRFVLPGTETVFEAKARLMWVGDGGRVGIRFVVIEPALFEHLQHWTNTKMRDEGWEFPF